MKGKRIKARYLTFRGQGYKSKSESRTHIFVRLLAAHRPSIRSSLLTGTSGNCSGNLWEPCRDPKSNWGLSYIRSDAVKHKLSQQICTFIPSWHVRLVLVIGPRVIAADLQLFDFVKVCLVDVSQPRAIFLSGPPNAFFFIISY